ncbi:SigE family RNA polymerase sigma factor [Polymorphospora sp. NPDC050346]|uniref:SigE family RNA polymerase sigma factor n=1 Tax=Polymorphospora sp. NPDC050346 TaxID=3155780 RepID=UPI0033F9FB26
MTVTIDPRLDEPPGEPDRAEPAAAETDAIGFDEFYHAHYRALTVQMYAYTNDLGQAQELVQEAFCRAFARWDKVIRYDDPLAWVRRVAWNLATSRWRRLRTAQAFLRRQRTEDHVPEPSPDRVVLAAALAQLPPKHRRAILLHYLADLTIAEIAHQEGVADGTVKSWLHRGRTALATQLAERKEENHG